MYSAFGFARFAHFDCGAFFGSDGVPGAGVYRFRIVFFTAGPAPMYGVVLIYSILPRALYIYLYASAL
jgi:hypothetical protein